LIARELVERGGEPQIRLEGVDSAARLSEHKRDAIDGRPARGKLGELPPQD
jgi:hypothetical protein